MNKPHNKNDKQTLNPTTHKRNQNTHPHHSKKGGDAADRQQGADRG